VNYKEAGDARGVGTRLNSTTIILAGLHWTVSVGQTSKCRLTRGPGLALLSVQFVVGEVFLGVVDRAERKEREGGVIAGS
jgi:hypothetical protein